MIQMTRKEIDEFKRVLQKQGELVRSSKEAARELLINVGVLTADGRLTERFKQLQSFGPDKSASDVRY